MTLHDDLRRVASVSLAGAVICAAATVGSLAWTVTAWLDDDGLLTAPFGFALAELAAGAVFGLITVMVRHVDRTYAVETDPLTTAERSERSAR